MSRYTAAYSGLVLRLKEIRLIVSHAKNLMKRTPTPANLDLANAACRGGIVLLCSHIEGYIEELGECSLNKIAEKQLPKSNFGNRIRYYLSRDYIDRIKTTQDKERLSKAIDDLFSRDGHLWDGSPRFRNDLTAEIFIGDFSSPTHKKIIKFFNRFGFSDFSKHLGGLLDSDYRACSNMIDTINDQRNKIAHGNVNIVGSPIDLENMMNLSKKYCMGTDKVVADWFKSKNCSIRSNNF